MGNGVSVYDAADNTLTLFFVVIIWFLHAIAFWRIFSKSGETGWKSLIPVYSNYILFKIAGKQSLFPTVLILAAASAFLNIISNFFKDDDSRFIVLIIWGIIIILCVILSKIYVDYSYSLSKAFGHGIAFALGLIFLEPIFILILGFGRSQYRTAS